MRFLVLDFFFFFFLVRCCCFQFCVYMVYVPGRIREGPGGRGFDGQTMSLLSNRIGGKPKKI